ncbi:hypothetical protein EPN52_00285 [bacterium]|nr:MAG: hypothetical protein EPN52_00285 [bacterium]
MSERTWSAKGWSAETRSRLRPVAVTLALICAHLLITLPLAYLLNVWQDDAYTLASTSHGLRYAIHQAVFFEQNAPFYFAVMALWRIIGPSYVVARLFSVLCAAGVVALLPALLRRYLPEARPAWIILAFAFNPFLIWAAVEIRLYALVILLSALLLLTYYDAFLTPRPSLRALAAYTLLCVVSAYTQYYLLALVAAQGILLLPLRRRLALTRFAGSVVVTALAFLPMLRLLPQQLSGFRASFIAPSTPLVPAQALAEYLLQFVLPLTAIPHHHLVYTVLLLMAAAGAVTARLRAPARPNLLMGTMLALDFALFALAVFAAGEHLIIRHAASLFVATLITAFSVATLYREPVRSRAVVILALTVFASSAITLAVTYRPLAKIGDWARLTAYLESHEQPGQPVLVFEAENAVPLAYYYRGSNAIVPIPTAVDFRTYNVDRFVLRDGAQVATRIAAIPGEHRTLWLVTGRYCHALNIDFGCDVLERYVRSRYRTLATRTFYGSELRLLQRAP